MLRKLHTNPSKLFLGRPKNNLEGFVWSFLSITGQHLRDNLPRNAHILTNPIVSEISFL